MNALKVSVIIPAYRAAHTIGRAVQSVLDQTYSADEILVVDDGSPDDMAAALRPFGQRVTLVRKENGGAASARNLGIERSSCELIAFLDADDYWAPHKLERQIAIYHAQPGVGLTCSRFLAQEPGGDCTVWRSVTSPDTDRVMKLSGIKAFEFALSVWTGTVVVPRAIVGDDRFVAGLEPAEDRDLWRRLVLKAPVCLIAEPLATAVLEPNSLSRSNLARDYGNMLKVIDRHREQLGFSGVLKWKSHTYYSWASCEPAPGVAMRLLLRSMVGWPLPYPRSQVRRPAARPALFARLIGCGLRKVARGGRQGPLESDAAICAPHESAREVSNGAPS